MNGQYLCNRQITVSYAYKKDTKGERHGTPAGQFLMYRAAACVPYLVLKLIIYHFERNAEQYEYHFISILYACSSCYVFFLFRPRICFVLASFSLVDFVSPYREQLAILWW